MTDVVFRTALPSDAGRIAELHADSWRRYYRGAYADAFLDTDVVADRRTVWEARLATPLASTETIVANQGGELAGFVHVVLDADPRWGALLDNLHVTHDRHRRGIGSELISRAAGAVPDRGPIYLWVLEQNTAAQAFYRSLGGRRADRAMVEPPGGVAGRLNGSPAKLRYAWSDTGPLTHAALPGRQG